MNWIELWMNMFGTTEWLGVNIGFWAAMFASLVVVIIMNAVFWKLSFTKKREDPSSSR